MANKMYRKSYVIDKGVDLMNDPLYVDSRRSPLCLNMIRSENGTVEKRVGWRIMHCFDERINGLAFCRLLLEYGVESDNKLSFIDVLLVHAGTKLYAVTVTPELRKVLERDERLSRSDNVSANANWILRYIVGEEPTAEDWQIRNADENRDGIIDVDDAKLLLKYQVHIVENDGLDVRVIGDSVKDTLSCIFVHEGNAYFMDGENFLRIKIDAVNNGYNVELVRDCAYVPTTSISAYYKYPDVDIGVEPDFTAEDGEWQDGEPHEELNLLINKRINTMCGDGLNVDYWLDAKEANVTKIELYELVDNELEWVEQVLTTDYTVNEDNDRQRTKITFTTAPAIHPLTAGLANIRVTFTAGDDIVSSPIERCQFVTKYGYFNDNRWFASGNPLYPNRDYESGIDDPTYWPEHGWTNIGGTASPIKAYVHFGEALGVIKADDKQMQACIFAHRLSPKAAMSCFLCNKEYQE